MSRDGITFESDSRRLEYARRHLLIQQALLLAARKAHREPALLHAHEIEFCRALDTVWDMQCMASASGAGL